mmetsp:Transcript_29970/g.51488  ORF Transcript_29970/g.51488 Transcript_29970/m.51488 type:complete len:216 (+) Transcript_29970:138-785(+)
MSRSSKKLPRPAYGPWASWATAGSVGWPFLGFFLAAWFIRFVAVSARLRRDLMYASALRVSPRSARCIAYKSLSCCSGAIFTSASALTGPDAALPCRPPRQVAHSSTSVRCNASTDSGTAKRAIRLRMAAVLPCSSPSNAMRTCCPACTGPTPRPAARYAQCAAATSSTSSDRSRSPSCTTSASQPFERLATRPARFSRHLRRSVFAEPEFAWFA